MKKTNFTATRIKVNITSADVYDLLRELSNKEIVLYNISREDILTIYAEIQRGDFPVLQSYVLKKGGSIRIVEKNGFYWALAGFFKRPVLIAGCLLLVVLTFWLPSRVLFVKVKGNITIPEKRILEKAQSCGISFGASRRDVRSEKMKNSLLAAIPELQWAGINTYGCTAVISVTERNEEPAPERLWEVCNIVAVRDGVISSCTATSGTAVCKIGQVVKQGEVLISGYTDCGIKIQATRADGEIFAKTNRTITVVVPTEYVYKEYTDTQERRISLIIGKKQINFCKDSGIFDMSCVRMYKRFPVTLPGGFELPVAVVCDRWTVNNKTTDYEDAETTASSFARSYLKSLMISGTILESSSTSTQLDGVLVYESNYLCTEMIGRVQYEGITKLYAETD